MYCGFRTLLFALLATCIATNGPFIDNPELEVLFLEGPLKRQGTLAYSGTQSHVMHP
jgi:hypothetical protein